MLTATSTLRTSAILVEAHVGGRMNGRVIGYNSVGFCICSVTLCNDISLRKAIFMKTAFICACSWHLETSQLSSLSLEHRNDRCSWVCYLHILMMGVPYRADHVRYMYIYIRRGSLCCSFRQWWAMRRPPSVGWATKCSHAFLYLYIY